MNDEQNAPPAGILTPEAQALAEEYAALRQQADALAAQQKALGPRLTDMNTRLLQAMEASGCDNVRLQLGLLYIKRMSGMDVAAADKPKAVEWLKENGYEACVFETFKDSDLAGIVKERADQNLAAPDFVKTFSKSTLAFKAAKA